MSRGPPLPLDASDPRIEKLDDGFTRLGGEDTPYTLIEGADRREKAAEIHADRPSSDQEVDEKTNEPVVRDVDEWAADLWELDFPFVDTIPHEEQRERAGKVADLAFELGYLEDVTHGVAFANSQRRGKFWQGPPEIETRADPDDFLGFRKGPALAHELGHAFYTGAGLNREFHDASSLVFETDQQERGARQLSVRLHGPFSDAPQGLIDEREHPTELFADVFAARVIEPEAARREGRACHVAVFFARVSRMGVLPTRISWWLYLFAISGSKSVTRPGCHSVRIFWIQIEDRTSLRISSV